jgi:hypothetical protein
VLLNRIKFKHYNIENSGVRCALLNITHGIEADWMGFKLLPFPNVLTFFNYVHLFDDFFVLIQASNFVCILNWLPVCGYQTALLTDHLLFRLAGNTPALPVRPTEKKIDRNKIINKFLHIILAALS